VKQRTNIDVSQYSFDEFISFLFARDVPAENEKQEPWDWSIDVTFVPQRVCKYYVQLFRQPESLLERFSKSQLEQGFWAIQGPNLDCGVERLLSDTGLPFADREECIRSMFDLFARLFASEPLDSSVQMWWDSLCYDWHCGNRNRERGGEDLQLQDVMFQTLARILSIDSQICQGAALHGLGHLHHPGTPELVESYIREHPSLTKEWKDYALAAARFEVM
jgi:hypothetical protein